jgi:hypothetical protein
MRARRSFACMSSIRPNASSAGFAVTFHPETEIAAVRFGDDGAIEALETADGEQDRYTFTALAGSLVTVRAEAVTPGVPDLVLVIEDPFGVAVATDDNTGGGTNPLINNFEVQNTGTHTIVVSNVPGSGTGAYRLSLTIATRSAPSQISILGGDFQTGVLADAHQVAVAEGGKERSKSNIYC